MIAFLLGAGAWLAALVGAGYSHYRYRKKYDEIYRSQYGENYTGGTW